LAAGEARSSIFQTEEARETFSLPLMEAFAPRNRPEYAASNRFVTYPGAKGARRTKPHHVIIEAPGACSIAFAIIEGGGGQTKSLIVF